MDSDYIRKLPFFVCKVKQDGNSVIIYVPYGAIENMVRSLLVNNAGTIVEIVEIRLLDI